MKNINCSHCRTEIDAEDNFCRNCGMRLKPAERGEFTRVQMVSEPNKLRPPPLDNPWLILMMLFFVLGPLALPMLWHGRAFSRPWKWFWTLLVIVYTLFLCWLLWFITVKMILEPLRQLQF
ncbi:MAG: zinc-ribbon domain-containing protein [Pirellulales bacterium]|nr:zinc-ribbon domain-containing protein [Pirellulales bacterium]